MLVLQKQKKKNKKSVTTLKRILFEKSACTVDKGHEVYP